MNDIFLNLTVGSISIISGFLFACALFGSLTFAIVYMLKIKNILTGISILFLISSIPMLLSKHIHNKISNPFNEVVKNTPYKFNNSLELFKSNEIKDTELTINNKSGFKIYSFSNQSASSEPYSKIGQIDCGNLSIKDCVEEFKHNQEKIIVHLNNENIFKFVKNN